MAALGLLDLLGLLVLRGRLVRLGCRVCPDRLALLDCPALQDRPVQLERLASKVQTEYRALLDHLVPRASQDPLG